MPTEELFGAYHFLGESPVGRSTFMSHLRTVDVRISDKGLEQAMRAQPISDPADRKHLAKLLGMVAAERTVGQDKDKRSG